MLDPPSLFGSGVKFVPNFLEPHEVGVYNIVSYNITRRDAPKTFIYNLIPFLDMNTELLVYDILTKKRYNRDEPYLKDKLKERFHYFISHNKPIKLVGFWGVGLKNKPNWADLASCEFLSKLNEEVKQVYPSGIEFTFIFATLHGIHNGISRESIDSYT